MAKPTLEVIDAIRAAARELDRASNYQWGHMGSCNCGFLAQVVTRLSKEEIHRRAMMRHGDWNEQLNDYCPASGLPMDDTISELVAFGFDTDDLRHLERLSDPRILMTMPGQNPSFNVKSDVLTYLNRWAGLLEEELLESLSLPEEDRRIEPHIMRSSMLVR